MYIFVEDKIKAAIEDGEFDNLPGKGKPLDLKDEFAGMPAELKQAYKILKQAGYIANDKEGRKTSTSLDQLLDQATDGKMKDEHTKRKQFDSFVKERKLHTSSKFAYYAKKIYKKLF
ncbi:DUF1992 domain-containing protein [Oceanobacillus massiliensis]|uniref:DnaJ family domain-containing protein n=1 Tax=Oceanobacillus massiliensis TaxID=1465765 RepID=UPI0002887996|nr:DUF1992 domain-containing protein [Oceanobacillus massiliensis]